MWLLLVALAVLASACSPPAGPAPARSGVAAPTQPAKVVVPPATAAGAQLKWLLAATGHLPVPDAQVRAHFDAAFLAQFGPAVINQALLAVAGAELRSIGVSELNTVVAIISAGGAAAQVWLTVDDRGLISVLRISPVSTGPTPATWAQVDAALRSVAPRVRLLVGDVSDGSCRALHGIDPGTAAPIGAAFKLYVLDALGDAVASGVVRWNQPLTVTGQLKSLPAGELQNDPVGTRVSVLNTAAAMMSLSDNTATDMLINLVGRSAVEAALTTTGMASPALDRPLLTTREIVVLKLRQWPALATRYIAADEPSRRALLASTVDRAPLPAVADAGSWITPRDVNSLEYFASASDICRAYAALAALAQRPGLSPIGQVLSLNDDSLALDPAQWKTTWFKGGSEPGVLSLAYLATTRTGHSYVVTVLAENPSQPINETTATPVVLSAIKGAFTLAARGLRVFRAVRKPLPRHLADAVAFVFRRGLPGVIEIGGRQQAVGQQEVGEITSVTAFFPDEALEQLLIVRYRALAAQVQGDDHVHHRHRLRGAQAEDELLVVVSHGQTRGRVAPEVTADPGDRVLTRIAAAPDDRPGPGGRALIGGRDGRIGAGVRRGVEPQLQYPRADADQPRAFREGNRLRLVAGRGDRQDVAGRPPHGFGAQR